MPCNDGVQACMSSDSSKPNTINVPGAVAETRLLLFSLSYSMFEFSIAIDLGHLEEIAPARAAEPAGIRATRPASYRLLVVASLT